MTRIKIDLNSLRGDGLTRARRRNADGELRFGMMVTAFEPHDRVAMPAYVERAEEGSPYVFLRVNRSEMRDDLTPEMYTAIQSVLAGSAMSNPAFFTDSPTVNDSGSEWRPEVDETVAYLPNQRRAQSA